MSYSYAWEQLYGAVSTLVGQGDIKERLASAWSSRLIRLETGDFPEKLQTRFQKLLDKAIEADPVGDEGRMAASIQLMTSEETQNMANEIFNLYNEIIKIRD